MLHEWVEWKLRIGYTVAQCQSEWALGSGFKFARNKYGFVLRFWSRKAAEKYADHLNKVQEFHWLCNK